MAPTTPVPRFARIILLVNALVFLGFGAGYLIAPGELAELVDLAPSSPTALADIRAIYGGLPLAIGLLFVFGLRRPSWSAPSLFLALACAAGAALARIYSIAVSGIPDPLVLVFLTLELAGFAWALLGYRALAESGAGVADPTETPRAVGSPA